MNCNEIKELLWLYPSDELDPRKGEDLRAHMEKCPACSKEFAFKQKLMEHLPLSPQFPDSYWESYTQKILARLEDRKSISAPYLRRWATAFALALFIASGSLFYKSQEQKQPEAIIRQMELLENLDLLAQDDFENQVRRQ